MSDEKNPRRRKSPSNTEWRGNTLHGRIRIKGKLKRWSLRTGDLEVARFRVKEDIARLKAAAFYGDQRVLFDDLFASWAERHIEHQVGYQTAKRYVTSLVQLLPFLRGRFLDEINTKEKLREIHTARLAEGRAGGTIHNDFTALSSLLEFADVDENHAKLYQRRIKARRDPIVLPDPVHIERMIKRAPGRLSAMVAAAWRTGCRLDELVTAERSKLDHPHRQLTVRGKGNKVRVIDLDFGGAYEILRSLPVRLGCRWLFWHGQGEPYRNLSSRFSALVRAELGLASKAAVEEGLDEPNFRAFRFHDLRHRHAVDWLKSGRSIYDLQQRLGHASIKTTEIYLKYLTPEEQRAAKYGSVAEAGARQGA